MPNVANITVAPTSRQPMMRQLLFWLLLVSQLSVGVLGARAAEITATAAVHLLPLHLVTAEMMDQHALRQISQCAIIDLPDADTVRPRKLAGLQHHVFCVQPLCSGYLYLQLVIGDKARSISVSRMALKRKADKRAAFAKSKATMIHAV